MATSAVQHAAKLVISPITGNLIVGGGRSSKPRNFRGDTLRYSGADARTAGVRLARFDHARPAMNHSQPIWYDMSRPRYAPTAKKPAVSANEAYRLAQQCRRLVVGQR
jgi:hypothetical protein